MSIKVSEEILGRAAYSLEIKLSISPTNNTYSGGHHAYATSQNPQRFTPKIGYTSINNIDGRIEFQVMFFEVDEGIAQSLVKFTKKYKNDKESYNIVYEHSEEKDTNIINKQFLVEDSWQSVSDFVIPATYIIKLRTTLAPVIMSYANIHGDTELTDFQLRGTDGSVHMHKAVAAASSPFFKTLFAGSWRENTDGIVDVPETSVETLQQLKDYMYLAKLPESGDVTKLLLLSSCYLMPDLETRCVYELCKHVTTDTAYELIQFAVKHNMSQLLYEILLLVQQGKLDVNEMKNLYNASE